MVLGGLGIIMAVLMIVPPCLILESHEYYFNEYIREQKTYGGKSYDLFSKANIALKKRAESFNQILFAKISQVYLGSIYCIMSFMKVITFWYALKTYFNEVV